MSRPWEKKQTGKHLLLGQSPATIGKRNENLRIMLWKIQTPGGLNHGTRQKAPKDDVNGGLIAVLFGHCEKYGELEQSSGKRAKRERGKAVTAETPDGWSHWSAVGPWNQTSILR